MKKLLLIPTVLITTALAVAFVMPAVATGAARAVAPALHSVLSAVPAVRSDGSSRSQTVQLGSNQSLVQSQGQTTAEPGFLAAPADPKNQNLDRGHRVATAGAMNCGRYGNGFHGGKHDFVCPNRPFPAPGSPPVSGP
jgi:hypothetical protein